MRLLPRGIGSAGYPPQFYLLVGGGLMTATGFTMAFPFLTLYLNTQLGISMDRVGLVFVGNSAAGLIAQTLAGPIADRFGRKPVMVIGLLFQGCVSAAYTQANTFEQFVLLAALGGFFGAVFHPASSAMVIDLVGEERRAQAFGLMRVAVNLGWVIGPSLGGLLATRSYSLLFLGAAIAQGIYLVLLLLFARETLPSKGTNPGIGGWTGGYGTVLRDHTFLILIVASTLTAMVYTQLNTTMPVYLKQEIGIPESGYGLLMALNAGMVVLLQFPTTRVVERRNPIYMLALGSLLYAFGLGSIGWWQELPLFALSIVVLTVGEMIIAPVGSALVADLSPDHMRARYMAAFGLTWTLGFGLGPTWGGMVMQRFGAPWVWNVALVMGCISALAYLPLRSRRRPGAHPARASLRD
ncbi:MAG: MDR family MFS transporter [Chloroflexota bacterium]